MSYPPFVITSREPGGFDFAGRSFKADYVCMKPGGCTCTDPDATAAICRYVGMRITVDPALKPGEAMIVPNLGRLPGEPLADWYQRRADGSIKITGLGPPVEGSQ